MDVTHTPCLFVPDFGGLAKALDPGRPPEQTLPLWADFMFLSNWRSLIRTMQPSTYAAAALMRDTQSCTPNAYKVLLESIETQSH